MKNVNYNYFEFILTLIRQLYSNPACNFRSTYLFIDRIIFERNAEDVLTNAEREKLEKTNELYYRNYTGDKNYPN